MSRPFVALFAFALLAAPALATDPTVSPSGDAGSAYRSGDFAEAARRYAVAAAAGQDLSATEKAAWAHARIHLAAGALSRPDCSAHTAAAAADEVAAAMKLAPDQADVQKTGATILALARTKATAPDAEQVVETANFRVQFQGERAIAETVAKAAEAKRTATFKRWSGPPAGDWSPKCTIVLHPTAAAADTGTAHTTVRLADGKATERRIDLRTDAAGYLDDALPREIMHVVLADLFPYSPPPPWAAVGMAVLSGSPEEAGRYARTLPRCDRAGELLPVADLFDRKAPTAGAVTGFYCESVSLVDFLVKLKGEAAFTLFLRGSQRYGTAKALREQYGFESPAALEQAWKRAALDVARGQAP